MPFSRICFSPLSEKYGNFPSVLFVDDNEEECNRFAELCCYRNKLVNAACIVSTQPQEAMRIANDYFMDIHICDIDMPHIPGDAFIQICRKRSPISYFIAITGHSMDTAARAGASADLVVLKDLGYQDKLIDAVKEGIRIVLARKTTAGGRFFKPEINEFDLEGIHWRERDKINDALGEFNPQDHNRAVRTFKALALASCDPAMTKEEIATHAGFSSVQYMMKAVSTMRDVVGLDILFNGV